jgi:hypothetical protein
MATLTAEQTIRICGAISEVSSNEQGILCLIQGILENAVRGDMETANGLIEYAEKFLADSPDEVQAFIVNALKIILNQIDIEIVKDEDAPEVAKGKRPGEKQ